ncbi:unnamed protein product [Discosporangium mesarthrocarpum]
MRRTKNNMTQLLRNVEPEKWVDTVREAYGDDDDVKGMLKDVGKLMRMMKYYERHQ